MPIKPVLAVGLLCLASGAARCAGAESNEAELKRRFDEVVRPFITQYCSSCHGDRKQEAKLNLAGYRAFAAAARDIQAWEGVLERLAAAEMPPEKAPQQPAPESREAVIRWIRDLGEHEAHQNAGDPGPVYARRLSNAEYDYTIRDLTGHDLRPTREFPVDPANAAGFDNSGESLTMSPALVKKYLAAAQQISSQIVFLPRGFVFAPHAVVTDTDRDKYCVQRIIAFYERWRIDYADYFLAAWQYEHRAALGQPDATLADFANSARLSVKYLATVHRVLTTPAAAVGPLQELLDKWGQLPVDTGEMAAARRGCEALRDLVIRLRREYPPQVKKLSVKGISPGSQPLVLWANRQLAAQHTRPAALPADDGAAVRFCAVFPDEFVVSDRGPYFDPKGAGQGRLLTAGFHLMQGYFRDDGPLYDLVLDETGQQELDALWRELDFVTRVPQRQFQDFIFFERAEPPRFMQEAEFDFARSEDRAAISEEKMQRLAAAYLAKARRIGADTQALEAIETYFKTMNADIRRVEQARKAAEPSHLESLVHFAKRAWRSELSPADRDGLLAAYRALREQDGLGHEDAVRDTVASVLMSPRFLFLRFDPPRPGAAPQPLSDAALACRLSYFLWSSLPDDELWARAAAGDLHEPGVLTTQVRRMLADDRIRGLALEFGGNWLDVRRFEEHHGVDRERFARFTNPLRQAMFEEPIRFFIDMVRHNRSLLDFLDADDTFVNPVLAAHYGIPISAAGPHDWVHIEHAGAYGRGGLLPMAVFLTKNSPGLRTSPVKRGYWVVRRLLGEHIPPPPPAVPELPQDEAHPGELTLPQLLARHRQQPAFAGCHNRFDAVGLAFEGYGPIGERRDIDLGGRPVDSRAVFADGSSGVGVAGLRTYLHARRQQDFLDNFCRKLLAYGLGRTVLPSDRSTLAQMRARQTATGLHLADVIEAVVLSPQFLNQRGRDDPRE